MKRWPLHKAWFWETAPFFRLLLPLIAGIIVYDAGWTSGLSIVYSVAIILVCIAAYAVLLFFRKSNNISSAVNFTLLHVMLFFIAWTLSYSNDVRNDPAWFGNNIDKADAYVMRVYKAPQERAKTWKLQVELLSAIEGDKVQQVKGKALVYVYKDKALQVGGGDTVVIPNKWQHIKNAGNPFEFDYARYAARNDLYYQQFMPSDDIVVFSKGNDADRTLAEKVHAYSMDKLAVYINDTTTLGLMQSILVGDESNLDNDTRQAYSETGIIHIIAISGSHITIFFLLFAFLLGWIKHRKYHWLKYMLALPLIWFYVLMAEAPPSAVRAALMFTVLSFGFALQRQSNPLNYLFATAFVLLCAQPMWLFSIGFQLSFLAVLSLSLFYNPIYKIAAPRNIILKGLWGVVSASVAAEILVAPLVIYYFHLFPLLFVVANVVAYLFMGIVLVMGIFIVAFSAIASLATFIAWLTILLVRFFNTIVHALQQVNPESFRYLQLEGYELILLYLAIAAFAVYILKQQKQGLFIGLGATCVLLIALSYDNYKALKQEKLIVYNISGATRIDWIKAKNHIILYSDTGITEARKNYAIKPTHTGWHAWHKAKAKWQVRSIGNEKVLLLYDAVFSEPFHADYLIFSGNMTLPDPAEIKTLYSPKKVVLGNAVKRWQAAKWKEEAGKIDLSIHYTAEDGAFILTAE